MTRPFNVVELYAGTARSAQPFKRWRRAKLALLADADPYVSKLYTDNHPTELYKTKNLMEATPQWVRKHAGAVHILLGCPPCQGFSDNGVRNPHDRRNRHLRHYARLAVGLRPFAIAMENVPLAVGARAFTDFSRLIEEAGYDWTAGVINAALYGSCQSRQRLVFIAIRDDVGCAPVIPQPSHGGNRRYFNYSTRTLDKLEDSRNALLGVTPATFQVRGLLPYKEQGFGTLSVPTVGETLEGLPAIGSKNAQRLGHMPWADSAAQLRVMGRLTEGGQSRRSSQYFSQSYGRLHRRGLAKTITGAFPNAGSGRYWHPVENRSLTLREAARIQGYPDSFEFSAPYNHAAQTVGNALDGALAELIYRVIRGCLE